MLLLIMASAPAKTPSTGTKAPYPSFVEPALPFSVAKVPGADRCIHEIKFDGYRAQSISLEPFPFR
jgi:bifunctional non-homologous end joining protein LigD